MSHYEILIDGDPVVYSAGFAAERQNLSVVYDDCKTGVVLEKFYRSDKGSTALSKHKAWLKKQKGRYETNDIRKVIDPEPLSHALHNVKRVLERTDVRVREHPKLAALGGEVSSLIYLTGPGNFRDSLSTLREYKGNRDPSHKPHHYQEIRDYLTQKRSAVVVEGIEADDALGIRAALAWDDARVPIIASPDKDLDQIEGWHYDYRKDQFYYIYADEARYFFWKQVLVGDGTDNIPGAFRIGNATADRILSELDITDTPAVWKRVVSTYAGARYTRGYPWGDADAEELALETARLVRILTRTKDIATASTWHPLELEDLDD